MQVFGLGNGIPVKGPSKTTLLSDWRALGLCSPHGAKQDTVHGGNLAQGSVKCVQYCNP